MLFIISCRESLPQRQWSKPSALETAAEPRGLGLPFHSEHQWFACSPPFFNQHPKNNRLESQLFHQTWWGHALLQCLPGDKFDFKLKKINTAIQIFCLLFPDLHGIIHRAWSVFRKVLLTLAYFLLLLLGLVTEVFRYRQIKQVSGFQRDCQKFRSCSVHCQL